MFDNEVLLITLLIVLVICLLVLSVTIVFETISTKRPETCDTYSDLVSNSNVGTLSDIGSVKNDISLSIILISLLFSNN